MNNNNIVVSVENISKRYQLGLIGPTSLQRDLNRWWARVRGKTDPYLKIGQRDLSSIKGDYIWALKDVSFSVMKGQSIGIIGKNGAGKSTLLKVMSRITAPTNGKIKIKGSIGSLLEVGTGFHPELTGRENVYLNGAILGMSKLEIDQKFDEIVDFSEIGEYIDTPVKRYSSGMYVRLAFAVAAHLNPDILIVDEVLAVGDIEFQKKSIRKMESIINEGRTILYVSHNIPSVKQLCNRGILLDNGEIICDDDIETVVKYYLSNNKRAVEVFEDKYPMQIISIELHNKNGDLCNNFEYEENIILVISIKSFTKQKISLSIGLKDLNNNTIANISSLRQKRILVANKGLTKFSMQFKNILNEGDYRLELTLGDGHGHVISRHDTNMFFSSYNNLSAGFLKKGGVLCDAIVKKIE